MSEKMHMREIIKDKAVVNDDWNLLRLAEGETPESVSVPAAKTIVPLKVWQAQRAALESRSDIGVWIASDERPEELKGEVARFPVIAVDFPKFADGRGYSIAYNLRTRLGYEGELRAIGDVLRDQLFYMKRCGFTMFDLKDSVKLEDAQRAFSDYSGSYASTIEEPQPLFRRVQRAGL